MPDNNQPRTSNPTLRPKVFQNLPAAEGAEAMTMHGTVDKTGILLLLTFGAAAWTWSQFFSQGMQAVAPLMTLGALLGFVVALVTVFKMNWSPVLAPAYAVLEGLFVGGLSAMLSARFAGVVFQAVGLTFGTLFVLLLAYRARLIRATPNFVRGVVIATGGIMVFYLVDMVMGFFGHSISIINSASPWGIGFSVVVVIIAAMNLVLDFSFIEAAAEEGAPKYMEWYCGFSLMVTLIWLYLEILRLLTKLNER